MTFEEHMNDPLGGKGSDNAATLGTTDPNKYLRNRLWHAFEAGVKSGETDRRLQQTIEWYQVALEKLQK